MDHQLLGHKSSPLLSLAGLSAHKLAQQADRCIYLVKRATYLVCSL
jgi:hypothetical protein